MIAYSLQLDELILRNGDLTTLWTELSTYLSVTKIPPRDVTPEELEYRSLQKVARFCLAREFGRLRTGTSLTFGAVFGGYRVINESILNHAATVASASDGEFTNKPTVQLLAAVSLADESFGGNINSFTLGWSADAGVTWTPLTTAARPLREKAGRVRKVFAAIPQAHFWTGAAGYVPFNAPRDKTVVTIASFGGNVGEGTPVGKNRYAVMVNNNTDLELLAGAIFLTARDSGI